MQRDYTSVRGRCVHVCGCAHGRQDAQDPLLANETHATMPCANCIASMRQPRYWIQLPEFFPVSRLDQVAARQLYWFEREPNLPDGREGPNIIRVMLCPRCVFAVARLPEELREAFLKNRPIWRLLKAIRPHLLRSPAHGADYALTDPDDGVLELRPREDNMTQPGRWNFADGYEYLEIYAMRQRPTNRPWPGSDGQDTVKRQRTQ